MTSKIYNKPPLTLDQQAELLLNRGLQGISKEELIAELSRIAIYFGFNKSSIKVLTSWFQHLNLVRNICAHYSRLFTRSFIVRPMIPKGKPAKWTNTIPSQDRIYLSICIIITLLDICFPKHDFRNRLKSIMKMIRAEQLPSLGFPEDWQKQDLFQC